MKVEDDGGDGPAEEEFHAIIEKALLRSTVKVVELLSPAFVLDLFMERNLFGEMTTITVTDIRAISKPSEKNSTIHKKISEDPTRYPVFKECLAATRQRNLLEVLEESENEVHAEMKENGRCSSTCKDRPNDPCKMLASLKCNQDFPVSTMFREAESLIRKAIKRSTYEVTKSLKPDAILDLFEERAVFGANTSADDIRALSVQSKKSRDIYDKVSRDWTLYLVFKECLAATRQTDLLNSLEEIEDDLHTEMKVNGGCCLCNGKDTCQMMVSLRCDRDIPQHLPPLVRDTQNRLISLYNRRCQNVLVYPLKPDWREHVQMLLNMKPAQSCSQCHASFSGRKMLIRHLETIHSVLSVQCVFCEKVFKRTRDLETQRHCGKIHTTVNFPIEAFKERFLFSVAIFEEEFRLIYILDVLHPTTLWWQARARSLAERRQSSTRSSSTMCDSDVPNLNAHFELRHICLTPGQLSAEGDLDFGLYFARLSDSIFSNTEALRSLSRRMASLPLGTRHDVSFDKLLKTTDAAALSTVSSKLGIRKDLICELYLSEPSFVGSATPVQDERTDDFQVVPDVSFPLTLPSFSSLPSAPVLSVATSALVPLTSVLPALAPFTSQALVSTLAQGSVTTFSSASATPAPTVTAVSATRVPPVTATSTASAVTVASAASAASAVTVASAASAVTVASAASAAPAVTVASAASAVTVASAASAVTVASTSPPVTSTVPTVIATFTVPTATTVPASTSTPATTCTSATSATPSLSAVSFELPDAPKEEYRATKLIGLGALPLFPPARRSWDKEEVVNFPVGSESVAWPPKNWKSMSPDQRLLQAEFLAMRIWQSRGQSSQTVDRCHLLNHFNFLVLPGSLSPRTPIHDLNLKSCAAIYHQLRQIATGKLKNNNWLTMIESSAMFRNRSNDSLIKICRNVPLRL